MNPRLPWLVRLFLAAYRVLAGATHLHTLFRDEVLWAWMRPPQREAVNRIIYGQRKDLLPGGRTFEEGLFDWERLAMRQPPFPQAGRILLGGAGGGREVAQLCGLGYEVVAFEPSEPLLEGARQVVSRYPGSAVARASYADLVTAVERRSGPLAAHLLNSSFDAVLLGWGSFGYVAAEADRRRLLRAIRALAPAAPILLSTDWNRSAEDGRLDRLRPLLRGLFRLLGYPSARQRGDVFLSDAGFSHCLTQDEIEADAGDSGYRIFYCRTSPYPHAVLMPN
ncbi:MAG: hypothetical protein ABSC23_02360 [Bryobacteraceae bacterium]|jgi:hypothetical protein